MVRVSLGFPPSLDQLTVLSGKMWMHNIKDWTRLSVDDLLHTTQDITHRRKVVAKASVCKPTPNDRLGHDFFFLCRVLHTIFSHLRAHAFARSVTVARSSAVRGLSSRRQERRWAIVCGSPQSQSTDWAAARYLYLLITVFA